MSARGAQSRKAIQKNIERKEQKQAAKELAESFGRARSGSSGWSFPSRRPSTSQNDLARKDSHFPVPSGASASGFSIHSGSGSRAPSVSGLSLRSGNENKNYQSKGTTAAYPRGRGGGVSAKAPSPYSASPLSHHVRSPASLAPEPVSSASTEPWSSVRRTAWPEMKVWHGNGRSPEPWLGFQDDVDLRLPDADCGVWFSDIDERPLLRIHAERLRKSRSIFMINVLRFSENLEERDDLGASASSSRSNTTTSIPLTQSNLSHLDEGYGSISPSVRSFHQFNPLSKANGSPALQGYLPNIDDFTMPISAGASDTGSPSGLLCRDPDRLDYSVWFQAPAHVKAKRDGHELAYRHNIATRNFIALLYGKPMVGRELHEMLSDLHSAMVTFYELNPEDQRPDITRIIVQYLLDRKLDEVSGDIGAALGLLRWCEQPHVMWEQGYLEAFVHCAGMMSEPVIQTGQLHSLSRVTVHNLETAYTALQLKIINAEEKLATFDFAEIWEARSVAANHPACKASNAFRKFLIEFYGSIYRVWPPQPASSGRWLSRRIVRRLQQDFGAVYDYLVDRDIVWYGDEARPNRKWEMISRVPRPEVFRADSPSLPMTDMLVSFDSRHKYEHLPRPYPLLPQDLQSPMRTQPAKRSFFIGLKKAKAAAARDPKEQFQLSLAFNGATNINRLGTAFEVNDLVDALSRHEKTLDLRNVASQDARIGRWILLYGILQVLSTLSVDAHGLQHAGDEIDYFLNPSLAGCPPWRKPSSQCLLGTVLEATQRDSYCWRAVERWDEAEEYGGLRQEMADGRDVVSELDGRSLEPSLVEKMYSTELDREEVKPEVPKKSPRRLMMESEGGKGNVQGYFAEENGSVCG